MIATSAQYFESPEAWLLPQELYSAWSARGLYSPIQFVLRLRPDVHAALRRAPAGWLSASELDYEQLQAASTYLHETIHWWQHVGSSSGLILSLLYPAQAHLNHSHLKSILSTIGPVKSIRDFNLQTASQRDQGLPADRDINVVLNNWHDLEFYRYFVTDPTHAPQFVEDKYFESQCHSYEVALGAVLWLISSVMDPDLTVLPDPRTWETESRKLQAAEAEGFYYGSPVRIPPVGVRQIFEGQARISQLQYLYRASTSPPSFQELVEQGQLAGVYGEAIAWFIELSGCDLPDTIHSPAVAAFLLVCDIAINPIEGLANHFSPLAQILEQHDPGHRFTKLSQALKGCLHQVCELVADYSASGYRAASEMLCTSAGVSPATALAAKVNGWVTEAPGLRTLLDEDTTFAFQDANLPVRVFVARFARFQCDKLRSPELFCWPGHWGVGRDLPADAADLVLQLFDEHGALFVDKEDGDVYPRILPNRDQAVVHNTFNRFYAWVATYDLVRQWTTVKGPFEYNFGWLTTKFSQDEVAAWVEDSFAHVFSVRPSNFRIV